jgi:hypothetical protein
VTPEDIGAGLSVGFLLVFWLAMMALNIAIYVFYVWSLRLDPWLAGIGIAFIIPFGYFVTPFMWWAQVRKPRRQGRLATSRSGARRSHRRSATSRTRPRGRRFRPRAPDRASVHLCPS